MSHEVASRSIADGALARIRAQLAVPARIADRYVLSGLLGRGGRGEVHRAVDERLGREVAIKLLAREASAGVNAERLLRESRILARLEHPGIVAIHDAGLLEDGRAYYVMRLIDGARLDEHARSGISRSELLRTLRRVAEAVAFAHGQGIVHRDLKPGNVMIGRFGEVLVLDWGVAKPLGEASPTPSAPGPSIVNVESAMDAPRDLTAAGTAVGTPGYMAPEQAAGAAVDARADVYSLGVMLREALEVHADPVPRALRAVVTRATDPEAGHRYPDVLALAEDLRRWLDGEPVSAHHEGPFEVAWRFARRHQVAILLLLTYAVVRTVILIWRGI